jgi:hypothetical protein
MSDSNQTSPAVSRDTHQLDARRPDRHRINSVVADFVRYLESGGAPQGLFAPDVFADLTMPLWRVQAGTADDLLRLRAESHPDPGVVRVERVDRVDHGFVMAFEERWSNDHGRWYARELVRGDVVDGHITELTIYCTGDWDAERCREHDRAVTLIRP